MQGLQDVYAIEGDNLWHSACGLGGGLARYQSVCGAITGGIVALGIVVGRAAQDAGKRPADEIRPKVRRLLAGFEEEFGDVNCRQLSEFDFNAPDGYQNFRASGNLERICTRYVAYVVETLSKEGPEKAEEGRS